MQIIAQCPRCSQCHILDADAADKRIRCSNCHRLFKIPRLDELPKATRVIRSARTSIYVDKDGKTYG